jgi:non-specific serine/threonine protein kinase/serine/threonine-protein kinase
MSKELYAAVREAYLAVLELPPEERTRYLEGTDPAVRTEVEELLARDSSVFLDSPAADVSAETAPAKIPKLVGPYRILRPLGEGGMGMVFEAERDYPKRRVALKVLRRALPSETELRLFEREAHTLALLQHPNIAAIYEAGTIEEGLTRQPYIAMELIAGGRPLLRYAQEENLDRHARLRLVVEIARAVHYAHQRGVVHLDLKPDNVLADAEGRPRVLDFGIARVEREGGEATGSLTDSGAIVGTLAYMSPEQASGERALVDVRSDVYSLGVVAYELLTGERPLELRDLSLEEALRAVRESPARAPSKADPSLAGDLDAILLKALEKDRERRYGSASELADDLVRHIEKRPVESRPPSLVYSVGRFVRRRPGAVAAASLVAFFALFSVGSLAWGVNHYRRGMQEAARSETDAWLVTDFTQSILSGINPGLALQHDATLLRIVMDWAMQRLETELQEQPVARGRLLYTIGRTLASISNLEQAVESYEEALRLQRTSLGEDHKETLETMSALALVLRDLGQIQRSTELLEVAHAERVRKLGPEHADTRKTANNLGLVYLSQGRAKVAEQLLRAAIGTVELDELPDKQTLDALYNQALNKIQDGAYEEAAVLFERLLSMDLGRGGPTHPDALATMNSLAGALENSAADVNDERLQRALTLYETTLGVRRQVLGPGHQHTLSTENGLAKALTRIGELGRAEDLYLHVLAELPENHTHAPTVRINYALNVLFPQGRKEEAFARLREGDAFFAPMEVKPYNYGLYQYQFGQVLRAEGQLDEAEERLLLAYDTLTSTDGADHNRAHACAADLVLLYRARGAIEKVEYWEERVR